MREFDTSINIICLETEAFYRLVELVVDRVKVDAPVQEDRWIDDKEAMNLLRISAKSTLQRYRDEGRIRFTQPSRKVILYDRESILAFLEKHAKEVF